MNESTRVIKRKGRRCFCLDKHHIRNMKFAIINSYCGYGSTGNNVIKCQERLIGLGHEARIYYGLKNNKDGKSNRIYFGNGISSFFADRLGVVFGVHGMLSFIPTFKLVMYLSRFKPDIVWLNNIHGDYVNEYMLLSYLKRKKVMTVYGMPDEYAFLGKCTNVTNCSKYEDEKGCHQCPCLSLYPKSMFFDNSHLKFLLKKKAYEGFDNLVFRSAPYVISNAKKSWLLRNKELIENDSSVDIEKIFYPRNANGLRRQLGISRETRVMLLCAPCSDEKKGAKYFLEAANICYQRGEDIVFVNISYDGKKEICPANFIPLPFIDDKNTLAEYYSLADAYVCTSIADAQPNTCLEALGCGTPVVGFNISGTPYVAPNSFGTFVEPKNVEGLADAICNVQKKDEKSIKECHQYAKERFSLEASEVRFSEFVNKICDRVRRRIK